MHLDVSAESDQRTIAMHSTLLIALRALTVFRLLILDVIETFFIFNIRLSLCPMDSGIDPCVPVSLFLDRIH